jgi:hypothetical protein
VDQAKLQDQVAELLGLTKVQVMGLYRGYRALHEMERYAERFGELKTLCFEEAFVLYAILSVRRPRSLVAIGSRDGRAVRRLLDMRRSLALTFPTICVDVENRDSEFNIEEVEHELREGAGRIRVAVLDRHDAGLIFLDARDYGLLREVVNETLVDARGWIVAIQSCGRGLCNPRSTLDKNDARVTTLTGLWDRYVLADAFGVSDPLDPRLESIDSARHRLRILETPHGLGVIVPK